MQTKYKILFVTMFVAVFSVSIVSASASGLRFYNQHNDEVKNVIVLVPDGCSQSIETIARWYKGTSLYVDQIVTGTVETWMANSVITDSAPASTAFATGHKSTDKFISVGPRTSDLLTDFMPTAEPYVPLATILEAANLEGKATGLVATSTISHATPAGYAAHTYSRADEADITEQMVYNDVDVVFGGGAQNLFPKDMSFTTSFGAKFVGARADGENLYEALISRGYQFVDSKDTMTALDKGKVWGLFSNSSMQPDIDRAFFAPAEPSLAEMTSKALELLSQDKDGFFIMIEGSQVDWADHANDPIYDVTDFLAFDEAVGVALNFAKEDGKTLVMAFPDHNCGGLSLGNYYQNKNSIGHDYVATTIEDVITPLQKMEISSTGLVKLIGTPVTDANIKTIVNDYWNIALTDDDVTAINALLVDTPERPKVSLEYAISEIVCKKYTVFGWTTHGHTGDDVPLWAWGPKDSTPVGHYDNTDLAKIAAKALDVSLSKTNEKLYVNVEDAFPSQWTIDKTDPLNMVLEITVDGKTATLPISKDVMTITKNNGHVRTFMLEGITVYAPTRSFPPIQSPILDRVYISEQVVRILK
ncbi:MAG: alkaline phosphatase [Thermoproteota archaeon]|nr:alkaline phosphatase [Thermoproteota archaeon]